VCGTLESGGDRDNRRAGPVRNVARMSARAIACGLILCASVESASAASDVAVEGQTPVRQVQPLDGLQGRALKPGIPQGRSVRIAGIVQPASFSFRRPSRYFLRVDLPGNKSYTVRYLVADRQVLFGMMGRYVRVEGREYWLDGNEIPVLVADRVIDEPAPDGDR